MDCCVLAIVLLYAVLLLIRRRVLQACCRDGSDSQTDIYATSGDVIYQQGNHQHDGRADTYRDNSIHIAELMYVVSPDHRPMKAGRLLGGWSVLVRCIRAMAVATAAADANHRCGAHSW